MFFLFLLCVFNIYFAPLLSMVINLQKNMYIKQTFIFLSLSCFFLRCWPFLCCCQNDAKSLTFCMVFSKQRKMCQISGKKDVDFALFLQSNATLIRQVEDVLVWFSGCHAMTLFLDVRRPINPTCFLCNEWSLYHFALFGKQR